MLSAALEAAKNFKALKQVAPVAIVAPAAASSSSSYDQPRSSSSSLVGVGSESAEAATITVNIIIPKELSTNKEDTAATVRVSAPTAVSHLHDTLIRRNIIVPGDAKYSVKSDVEGESVQMIEASQTIRQLAQNMKLSSAASTTLTLMVHPPVSALDVFVRQENRPGHLKVKIKPGQLCDKLMRKVCDHFKIPFEACQFRINGKVIRGGLSFHDAGVRSGCEIVVSQM